MFLQEDEVIEDLQRDDLKIIQNHKKYTFSVDSVLLSTFAKVKNSDFVVEFCSGSGVISILVQAKYHPKEIVGFEIEKEMCDMSNRSIALNNLQNIKFICDDIKNCKNYITDKVDAVISNPPYFEKNLKNKNSYKFEINVDISQILKCSKSILKEKGTLYLSYPISRLQELLVKAEREGFSLKEIDFAHNKNNEVKVVLLKFRLHGKNKVDKSSVFTI